ncbi:MAG TPA: hypothetical protein ENJ50_06070, partial [Planctomycetaceae bacterium]|nr:hypothetical protein [Planctomycetaceae bacterium]
MNRGMLSKQQERWLQASVAVGAALFAIAWPLAPDHAWGNLLVAALFLVTLGIGALFFLTLAQMSGAGWHVAFRRIPEAMAATLPATGIFVLVVLAIGGQHYHVESHDLGPTYAFKLWWLGASFRLGRALAIVLAWGLVVGLLVGALRRQDATTSTRPTRAAFRWSAVGLVVAAVTFSVAMFDWLMALVPMWYSTVFAAYQFAGTMQATLAVIVLLGILLSKPGRPLHDVFSTEHLHDLNKLVLGFSCFWMYLWFSQFMLIWYTNIPEESSFFVPRMSGAWLGVTGLSIFVNWLLP